MKEISFSLNTKSNISLKIPIFLKKGRKNTLTPRSRADPVIVLTLGDPEGIGPEIILRVLEEHASRSPLLVIAPAEWKGSVSWRRVSSPEEVRNPGVYLYNIESTDTDVSFTLVKQAADWAVAGRVSALVTGPISKEKWRKNGIPHHGHTDFLAHHAGVSRFAMCFWSEDLRLLLYTIHLPLQNIFAHIRAKAVEEFVRFADGELFRLFGRRFHFLFSGLNPHAGENGFLGMEERDEIIPALHNLQPEVSCSGPYPPDVVFITQQKIPDSVVVCWYHDQGLIPFKLLHFRDGINLTLGLPYIRTSPDHGTAFDIAGKGVADPSSMRAALSLAERLVHEHSGD